jgi:hypothetical protein
LKQQRISDIDYDKIKDCIRQFVSGEIILHVPAEFISVVWSINLKELPFDEYYISQCQCNTCGNIEYIAWSALDKGRSIFKCSNCNASELTPIPGEIT